MRIEKVFEEKLSKGERVIIPYITAGFPSLTILTDLINVAERAGCGMIEVGIPFSDPVADGPTIQYSSQKALEKGVNLEKVLFLLRKSPFNIPVILMGYYNPFYQFGLDKLIKEAKKAGVRGFIIPDLPLEESGEWVNKCRDYEIDTIFLVAPNTSLERVRRISSLSSGFLYCVSVTGITGAREKLPSYLENYLRNLRKETSLPRAVGFGISSPEHIKMLYPYAEGMIVGSAIINIIKGSPENSVINNVGKFLRKLVSSAR